MDRARKLVETPGALEELVGTVRAEERIGLDTESNGFHAYYEKVCLVQVATAAADWVIDLIAVDLKPLVPLLAEPHREVILHAAEYDVLCMKRDYGLTFGRIFDTHAAAKVLGIERVGLHNLLADELGVQMTIDEQKSDWGKRPLTAQQIEYAFADVQFLLPLRDRMAAKLAEKGLVREAEAEFARLTAKEPRMREFDPEGWQRMKAARTLDGRGRAVLRELYLLRDRRARDVNRPPFKVLSDLFLSEVARRLPRTEDELARVPGVSAGGLKRVAEGVLEAVKKGLSAEPLARPRAAGAPNARWRKGGPGAPPPEVEERFERLRAWRKARAEARKVEVQVIAPNAVLMAVARLAPASAAELAAVEGMDPFRVENYGGEILEVLKAERAAPAPREPGSPRDAGVAREPDRRTNGGREASDGPAGGGGSREATQAGVSRDDSQPPAPRQGKLF